MSFIRFLKYAEDLNDTEIFGSLHGVKAQINISSRHSEMMTIALLDFMAEKKSPSACRRCGRPCLTTLTRSSSASGC